MTTGNKSEMAVGYATLYGDMAGGFAPLKDCTKTLVYHLARYRNALGRVMPGARHHATADRRSCVPDQKDSDSLPPYDVLDPILEAFIERDYSVDQIAELGFDRGTVVARSADGQAGRVQEAPGAAGRAREQSGFRPRLALSDYVGLLTDLCGFRRLAESRREHAARIGRQVLHAERVVGLRP